MTNNFFTRLDKVFLIAEIGVNHNGDLALAKKLIETAKHSGADAVKFQTYDADLLVSPGTPKVNYQITVGNTQETHYEMLRRLQLSRSDHIELKLFCDRIGIEFLSTPYDIPSAKFLSELGVRLFKTASADLVDLPLHYYLASLSKPVIVATGMGNLGEVERVVNIYNEQSGSSIVLLHAVSSYPCSDDAINLRAMKRLTDAFSLPIGLSDHSLGYLAAVLSVAMGAKVIEKHFTLDKLMDGPDHLASSNPEEFIELVQQVRRSEVILGSMKKSCHLEEASMMAVSRKSITLSRDLRTGDIISIDDVRLMRPGTGLDAGFIESIIGLRINRNLSAGYQIKWTDFLGDDL